MPTPTDPAVAHVRTLDRPAVRIVRPSDVGGQVAWNCLVADGVIVPLFGTAARPTASPDSPTWRVAALSALVPPGAVLAGRSAAWVHVGGAAPRAVHVVHRSRAHRPRVAAGVHVRQASLLATDVVEVAGRAVTSVQRTALDLARHEAAEVCVDLLRLLAAHGFDATLARTQLEMRPHVPGRDAAHRVLDAYARDDGARRDAAAPRRLSIL